LDLTGGDLLAGIGSVGRSGLKEGGLTDSYQGMPSGMPQPHDPQVRLQPLLARQKASG
jgi:hypothetical protein